MFFGAAASSVPKEEVFLIIEQSRYFKPKWPHLIEKNKRKEGFDVARTIIKRARPHNHLLLGTEKRLISVSIPLRP